jgi:hypothetical protein
MYRGSRLSSSIARVHIQSSFPLKRYQSTASGTAAQQQYQQQVDFEPTIASSYPLPRTYKSNIDSSNTITPKKYSAEKKVPNPFSSLLQGNMTNTSAP